MTTQTKLSNAFSATSTSSGSAYLSGMSVGQVRRLTGVYAPTSGLTLAAVTPGTWSSDNGIIDWWGGGCEDRAANKLHMVGGGHSDSANNGAYTYDFNGASVPVGASLIAGSQSARSQVPAPGTNYDNYGDGRPSARHAYDGVEIANGVIYQFGGARYQQGGASSMLWGCLVAGGANPWSQKPSASISDRAVSAYDPTTGKILFSTPVNRFNNAQIYDPSINTWGSVLNTGSDYNTWPDYPVLGFDTNRRRVVVFGEGLNDVWTVNWGSAGSHTGESITKSTRTVAGSINGRSAPTPLFDAARDHFVLFGGIGSYTSAELIDAGTFALKSTVSFSGDTIPISGANYHGSYKRAILLGGGTHIGMVTQFDQPAVVVRVV